MQPMAVKVDSMDPGQPFSDIRHPCPGSPQWNPRQKTVATNAQQFEITCHSVRHHKKDLLARQSVVIGDTRGDLYNASPLME